MNYWLFKTEPGEFSIDDLQRAKKERWNGIRNYQARNFLRDEVQVGDQVFIYHSSCTNVGVVGSGKICKAAYADEDQFDVNSRYYDAKATREQPRWYCVDVEFVEKFARVVTLAEIKASESLSEMVLVKRSRLSIQPVRKKEWQTICRMV